MPGAVEFREQIDIGMFLGFVPSQRSEESEMRDASIF
jgi:hypothetical protein